MAYRLREWLPPALLLLALATLIPFGGDRGYFYRDGVNSRHSATSVSLAENLSPACNARRARAAGYIAFGAGGQALPYAPTRLSVWREFPEPDSLSLPLGIREWSRSLGARASRPQSRACARRAFFLAIFIEGLTGVVLGLNSHSAIAALARVTLILTFSHQGRRDLSLAIRT